MEEFCRTELLIQKEGIQRLKDARVAVFGIGGVGGYVVEALVRSGLGHIDLYDHDCVSLSNINRQIIATHQTIGQKKVDVMEKRIHDINNSCCVKKYDIFFLPENHDQFDFDQYDYIVDAIDTVTAKILLVQIATEKKIPIISSMGTGNKFHPEMLEITELKKTSYDPLARVIRNKFKNEKRKIMVVYSKEKGVKISDRTPGSTSLVPSVAGVMCASFIINDIMEEK